MLHSLKKRVHSLLEALMEDIPFGRWSGLGVGRQQASSNKEQGDGRWHPTGTSICKEVLPQPKLPLSSFRCIFASLEYSCHNIRFHPVSHTFKYYLLPTVIMFVKYVNVSRMICQ
jgi:hypothetical protein